STLAPTLTFTKKSVSPFSKLCAIFTKEGNSTRTSCRSSQNSGASTSSTQQPTPMN
ncbi:MAG: hypothetical protein HN727_06130, partial [Opitutae bacterium]|nr:hypothetical protein [Opitutae bacterium]